MKKVSSFTFIFFAFLIFFISAGNAQVLQRSELISAYMYNFAKNVYWQNEESLGSFHFLIVGDDENIIRQMQELSKTKTLRNKHITVSHTVEPGKLNDVQLIFITKEKLNSTVAIFDRIEGKNILLVTDGYSDKRLIMINFLPPGSDGKMGFEINKANILNQHLTVLQDIILLGGSEVDVASLYREGLESLRKLQMHGESLEFTIREKTAEINAQKENLLRQAGKIDEQQAILKSKTTELTQREKELADEIADIQKQQAISEKLSNELQQQKSKIAAGDTLLAKQKNILEDQQSQIRAREEALSEKTETISKQRVRLDALYLLGLCILFLFSFVFYRYTSNKKLNKELERKVNDRTLRLRNSYEQLSIELQERKQVEEALRQSEIHYRYLFRHNPVPMLVYELGSMRLLAVNDAFVYHYSYTEEEALKLHLPDLYPEEEKQAVIELTGQLRGMEYVGEWHHIKNDGGKITIEVRSHEFLFDGKTARIAVINDITERKIAEQALRNYQETLEDKVRLRTNELEIAKEKAESADRTKSAFLATMSHELRTPLNSIIGFTGILLQERPGPLNPEQKKQLGMAQNSAKHLLSLINDVLDISKIEAGQMKVIIEPVDVSEVINKVVALCNPLAQKKNLAVTVTIEPDVQEISSDKLRVQQVLFNLVSNAIKFTDFGGVRIAASNIAGFIKIDVTDSGIGIEKDQMEKLFKPFMQVDTGLTRKHEGTGLGLSICRHILDVLGGKIEVATKFGLGSTFSVLLPVKKKE